MPVTLDGKLVVALSSRAIFDFEEENRVFDEQGDTAYSQYQLNDWIHRRPMVWPIH